MKKQVLEISTGILRYDGMSKVLISLIDNAPKDKVEVSVLLGKGAIPEFYEELKKRHVRYFEGPDRELDVKHYIPYLRKLLKSHHFDVVHVHGNSATMALDLFIAETCGVKTRIAHSHNTISKHPRVHAVMKPFLNMVTNQPAACGQDAGKFLFNKKFTLVPNCIDVEKFRFNPEVRAEERKKLGIGDEFLIGNVGRFTYQKNHQFLIKIFNAVLKKEPTAKLLLIGDGELLDDIKKQVSALGISKSVIFYGTSDHVNRLMQAMDCFLLPSKYEGLSVTALEAQAAGLPCIMTDTISKETEKSHLCEFLPEGDALDKWADTIVQKHREKDDRAVGSEEIIKSGYDIKNLPRIVEKIWGGGKEPPS